jgi:NitT/TauT family transport system ATP-binding protein
MNKVIQGYDLALFYTVNDQETVVFDDLNLDIIKGEFTSIVGPSGCGKTSLLKIIAGLLAPSEGKINHYWQGSQTAKISYVPQQPTLLPFRTVLGNIKLPLELRGQDGTNNGQRLLKKLGLLTYKDCYPNSLSGGMQQKVSIARALVTSPRLVLMDEPFSALDELSREKVSVELRRWTKQFKVTVLFVTHNIEEAVFLSDRVIVLSGKPSQVVADVNIDLPERRTSELRTINRFFSLSSDIRKALRS